jgi:hypothetical protein
VRAVGHTLAEERHLLPAVGSGQSVREALGVPTTAFEVANAITATARTKGTAARLGLEEMGHRYLTRRAA